MKIVRLEVRNFEGYRNASVRFTDGLNIIVGRNSVGKTTLLDAILYALYGSVPGVEKRLLSSRRGSGGLTRVLLEFETSGRRVEVVREGKLIGDSFRTERVLLTVDGKPVSISGETELNKRIVELTGVGPKSFCALIYARQGELTRVLEPSRDEMDMALRISLMREVNEQLEEAARELEKYEGRDAKTLLEAAKERVKHLEESLADYRRHLAAVEAELKELEGALGKAASEEARRLLEAIRSREEAEGKIGAERAVLSSLLSRMGCSDLGALKALLEEVKAKHADACSMLKVLGSEEESLSSKVESLREVAAAARALLSNAGVTSIRDLEETLSALRGEVDAVRGERAALESEVEPLETRAAELRVLINSIRREVDKCRRMLEVGAHKCPTCGQDVRPEKLAEIIGVKEGEARRAAQEFADLEAKISGARARLDQLGAKIMELESRVRGLEEIRLRASECLGGRALEDVEAEAAALEARFSEVRRVEDEVQRRIVELESRRIEVEGALKEAERRAEALKSLEGRVRELSDEISRLLSALNLPFKASDPDLKAKIAGVLPISPETIEAKRRELEEKRKRKSELESNAMRAELELSEKRRIIEETSKRLEAASRARKIAEMIRAGIEGYRRRKLRAIADEALKVYSSLTDQRVYDAFRIREDDYTVEVHQPGLSDYIPARRVGGGHQTLIALALRIAMLRVMGYRSLLILDEPTYGVDSENLPQLMVFISEAAKKMGQTILVTHYELGLEEAANIIRVSLDKEGYSKAEQTT